MTHSSAVVTFVKPVISLTAMQQSVIGFLDSTRFGIASSPRQTGMTFALHSHLIYTIAFSSNKTLEVVFPNVSMLQHAVMEMKQFMSVVGNLDHIRFSGNMSTMTNDQSNVTISFRAIINVNDHTYRGYQIDGVIFADFDGYGPYAREIQQKLQVVMPSLRHREYTIHMIGTDSNSYVSNAHDDTSLMYAAMNGKSHFKLWNYQLSTMVDDMLAL